MFSQSYDQQLSDFDFLKVYFATCTRLTHLLRFASLFLMWIIFHFGQTPSPKTRSNNVFCCRKQQTMIFLKFISFGDLYYLSYVQTICFSFSVIGKILQWQLMFLIAWLWVVFLATKTFVCCVFAYLCICEFVYLCICEFVFCVFVTIYIVGLTNSGCLARWSFWQPKHLCVVYLRICVFVNLWICVFVNLWICVFVYLWICEFVYLFICEFVYLCICEFVYLCFCEFVFLRICDNLYCWLEVA